MPRSRRLQPPAAPLVAGLPWLDFINTRYRQRGAWVDALATPGALAAWLQATALAPPAGRPALAPLRGGSGGRLLLRQAHALRGALGQLARAIVDGMPVPERAIQIVNRVLRAAPTHRELRYEEGAWVAREVRVGSEPLALLAPIAHSAADFLLTGDRSRVRACGNPACVLFFYDRTRNGRRRFCSTATCGNRVKAARRYRRFRAAQSG